MIIFCDEAGNSGENLLDISQPFFVLASNDLTSEEAGAVVEYLASMQGGELKFKTLRKTPSGMRRLVRFLEDPRLSEARIVVTVFHKRYMVFTKLVDLIVETLIHDVGGDLYRQGANIAMSNMFYHCMPAFCGISATEHFLRAFVNLLRKRGSLEITAYLLAGQRLMEECKHGDFRDELLMLTSPELFDSWFDSIGGNAIDPAIPSLFSHMSEWAKRKADRFDVVHDQSKPILASEEMFHAMMATAEEQSQSIGYDRRKFEYPLRAASLRQADSSQHLQLQVADICAGAVNHFLKQKELEVEDEFTHAIKATDRIRWVVNCLVPGTEVTPVQLGTNEESGINPADPIAEHLAAKDWKR